MLLGGIERPTPATHAAVPGAGEEALASDDYTVQLTPVGALSVALADLQTLEAAPGNGDTVRLTHPMTCGNARVTTPTHAILT